MKYKIVGITGTLGAGKGTVVSYLVGQKKFTHYSARRFLEEEMKKEGLPIDRDSMVAFANVLREKHGPQYVFDQLYRMAQKNATPAVIESIRTIGEAEALVKQGGILLAVDADQKKRYGYIHGRNSILDHVTFEEFKAQEEREMHSDDPNKQSLSDVMKMADITILNNGTRKDLLAQAEKLFADW